MITSNTRRKKVSETPDKYSVPFVSRKGKKRKNFRRGRKSYGSFLIK